MAINLHLKQRSRTWRRPLAWGLAGVLTLPAAAWASGREPAVPAHVDPAAGAPRPETGAPSAASETASPRAVAKEPAFGTLPEALGVRDATMAARTAVPTTAARNGQRRAPAPQPDFLFRRPRASIGIRGLWHRARAGSDFYDFANEQLFVPRSPEDDHNNPDHGLLNFDAPGIGLDFGFGLTSRLDARIGVDYAKSLNESELRNFIGSDGLPYLQSTELSQVDLRGELAFALAPRGRAVGQYAWIPSRAVPYVGAGFSLVRYNLRQTGEFVDEIGYFEDTFASQGWGPGIHLFAGADIRMTQRVFLNLEVRHVQESAALGADFAGFDPLDLGGLRIGAGVRFAF